MENKKQQDIEKRLSDYEGDDRVISSNELYEILKAKNKKKIFMSSPFPRLNSLIQGFYGGELTTISCLTGQGKTLLAQTISAHLAEHEKHSLWFSYEVPARQFLEQFGSSIPHFYMPAQLKANSLEWIYNRIYEAKVKYGLEAVFADHLHFLADVMIQKNPSLEIGKVMRTLKRWALYFNISFFLLAHTTKIKADTELDLGDARDSSFVEQESDNVFYIWRKTKVDNGAVLKIAKNRQHGVYGKKIDLIKVGSFLKEEALNEFGERVGREL